MERDCHLGGSCSQRHYFNSHAHVERDFSIFEKSIKIWNFNSHAHVERDTIASTVSCDTLWFQLTRSRGAWQTTLAKLVYKIYFNSHAHVERDECFRQSCANSGISTHTLTWSVTITNGRWKSAHWFQLTRSRGAWPVKIDSMKIAIKFQLTRSRGAWRVWLVSKYSLRHFNSHAHVERD